MSLKPASINSSTVLAVIKDVDNPVTGVDVLSLARNVRNRMEAHPACTRKIEEILHRLIKGHFIVYQDSIARATTLQERLELIKAEREKIQERVIMTPHQRERQAARRAAKRRRSTPIVEEVVAQEETTEIYIPTAWSEFPPDTPPSKPELLNSCFPSERVLVSA